MVIVLLNFYNYGFINKTPLNIIIIMINISFCEKKLNN